MESKLPKSVAVYLPAALIGTERPGTMCAKCRDFIKSTSECVILTEPRVSGERGTCTQFIKGIAPAGSKPLKLVPKETVGYIEGDDVPTYCGRCKYFLDHGRMRGECELVEGVIEWGGCCNGYEAKDDQARE